MVSFKSLVVFAVLLLAIAGPTLARVYVLDDGVDDATDKPETTTTTTTTTTSTSTQLPTTLLPDVTSDDSPESNTNSTNSSSEEDEAQERIDVGDPPDAPIDRSDAERDHTWTPVALVKGASAKTPFEVYKHVDSNEKTPKRSGFRNVRRQRGSSRYSNSDTTQRPPPPPPPRLISMTFPERDMSSYMIHNQYPMDTLQVGSENVAVTVSPPPKSPPQVREDPIEDPYEESIGGVPPALAAVTAAGISGVVEDAKEDQDVAQANHGPRNQQAVFRPSEEWRNNFHHHQQQHHSGRQNNDKVISANGEVIQLIPFTIEDTVPRTTPTYFPHPKFNEQLKQEENNKRPEKQKENIFGNFHSTNPPPTPPTMEITRSKPRPYPTVSVKQRPFPTGAGKSQRNVTSSRNPNHKEEKRNRRPSFVSKLNTDLSQDTGITTTRSPNKPDQSNHPNGAFSRQIFNFGNKTVVEVAPTIPGGKKEVSFPLNATIQDRFNSSRNLRPYPTQSTSLGHRPIHGGFDRYRVPSGRPKVGYNVRTRPQGSNALHQYHHPHHHPHDNYGSSSINVGRVVIPTNSVVHTKPKPPPGFTHRQPSYANIPYQGSSQENPSPGAPLPPQPINVNSSSNPGSPPPPRYQSYPKNDYRPGSLPHPASLTEIKRPHSAHDHYPVVTIQKYRYPPPPPGYGKGRPSGPRPQLHPNEEAIHNGPQGYKRPYYGNDDPRAPQQGGHGRYPGGSGGLHPVRQGGHGGPGGSGVLNRPVGPNSHPGHGSPNLSVGNSVPSGMGVPPPPPNSVNPDSFGAQEIAQNGAAAPSELPNPSGTQVNGAGLNSQRYANGYGDSDQIPISTPLRSQYSDYNPGGHDEQYSSSANNFERYTPAPSPQYDGNNQPQYDSESSQSYEQNQPNAPNPTMHTYPFPTHPTNQKPNKPYNSEKPTGNNNNFRDEYGEDYYSPQNQRIRPTTIRPTGYKNPNKGFSVTEITQPNPENQPTDGRRPDDKPKHYAFPKLSSSTSKPQQDDSQVASSSQNMNIGGNYQREKNPSYAVYEEENYPPVRPTPRPRPTKYTQPASSTLPARGKTSYVSSSTSRPRYKARRPALKTTTDSQVAAGSISASYSAPPSFGGDSGKSGSDEDMMFTYAKTDYNGNVKWGVRHQVGSGGEGGSGGEYGH